MSHNRAIVRKLPYIVILIVLASIVVLFANQSTHIESYNLPQKVEITENQPLPDLRFESLSGEEFRLNEQAGRVTILHFWASWCVPCIIELPALNAFAGQYQGAAVKFVVVSLDNQEGRAKAEAFYKAHEITYVPLLFGSQQEVMRAIKLKGLPTTLFLLDGKQVARANADLEWGDQAMKDYVDRLLQ